MAGEALAAARQMADELLLQNIAESPSTPHQRPKGASYVLMGFAR
jgi:hypothetical protein